MAYAPQTYRSGTRVYQTNPAGGADTELTGDALAKVLAGAGNNLDRIQTKDQLTLAPGASPIATSGIRREIKPATSGTYASDAAAYAAGLKTTPPTEEDAAAIRERTLKEVQGQLDAIDAATAQMLSDEALNATERTGRTRAMSARGGRLTSDFGAREMKSTEALNEQGRQAIIRAQEEKKSNILSNVAKRSNDLIDAEKNAAFANIEKKLAYQKEQQTAAREDIKNLGLAGVTLDSLNDTEYKALMGQSGYDPLTFEAVYNSHLPGGSQREYTYLKVGEGQVARVDKAGGEPKIFDYSVPDGYTFKMAGDIPVFVNEKTQDVKVAAPGGDTAALGAFAKETELDTFTDASGNRVSVMYNPVTKQTRKITLGKSSDAAGGFKPQAIETSAVKQYLTDVAMKEGWTKEQTDKALADAMSDQGTFYGFLNDILDDKDLASRYYKPTTIGVPVGI